MAKITTPITIYNTPDKNTRDILDEHKTAVNDLYNDIIVDARFYPSLNEAVSAVGAMKGTLIVAGSLTTNANLTIPKNISLVVMQGGSINKNSTNTLDINGNFEAGMYKVFYGYNAGDVKFGKVTAPYVYPQWWGENITEGVTDMTISVRSAINSLILSGGVVRIPNGLYLINSLTIPYQTGVFRAITIEGEGKWNLDGATIYHHGAQFISGSASPMFAPEDHSDGVTLRNLYLNGNNIGTYGWDGVFGSFATIENCIISKFTNTGVNVVQGLSQLKYCYINQNGVGVKWGSDGIVEHNKIIGNTGDGIVVNAGGNYITDNEIEGNGNRGVYIDGRAGNNSNNIINNNYIENNRGWNVMLEGAANGNRTVSKCRITGNHISLIAITAGNTTGGIKLLNSRTTNISANNFIGTFNGVNTSEQQAILLENTDMISISNFIGENGYRSALKMINCSDIAVSDFVLRDFAYAGTPSDDAYAIHIDATCVRVYMANVNVTDYRGASGYMKGIKAMSKISLVNYSVSTPVATPDNFSGNLFYKNAQGNAVLSMSDLNGVEIITANASDGSLLARKIDLLTNGNSGFRIKQTVQNNLSALADGFHNGYTLENAYGPQTWGISYSQGAWLGFNFFDGTASYVNAMKLSASGEVVIPGNFTAAKLQIGGVNTAPASATAPGISGEIRFTSTHVYFCHATNTWVRAALTTW